MKKEKPFITIALAITRILLKSRYKVTVTGLNLLDTDNAKLFLPNHQAVADPMILLPEIFRVSSAVPVVTEGYFNMPIVNKIFRYWGAISVSDLESGSRDTSVLDEVSSKSIACLKQNHNVIIYPSGQIAGQGFERIINKQSAWKIASELPENAVIIGVRIRGLWGSVWSKAWTGKSPKFGAMFVKSLLITFANLMFFVPKRRVTIEFYDITRECKEQALKGKICFNQSLEKFYNANGEESANYLKHYFFSKKSTKKLPLQIDGSSADIEDTNTAKTLDDIPLNTFKKTATIVAKILKQDESKIKLESNLILDLGCDSLNLVEIVAEMERVFSKVVIPDMSAIRTISDLCLATLGQLDPKIVLKEQYFDEKMKRSSRISVNNQQDIVSQFISHVKESPNEWMFYDEMMGSTKRRDFFLKALVVSEIIKKKSKKPRVAIMLPALQSSTLLILSTYLAKKTPVMLNWTVGPKILEHCVNSADIDVIFTAERFLNKIKDQIPESLLLKMVLVENEVPKIGIGTKIKALINSRIIRTSKHRISLEENAVVLFTSGSEDLPKAVPLTHKNIVSNLSSVFTSVNLSNELVFVGFLPPFHSFGFTVLSILPLVSGVRVGYTPDPTDGKGIARLIKHIGGNVVLGSPSFLKIVLSNGAKSDFTSLKYAISGAEAMPSYLIHLFKSLTRNATLLEGYGITECSPVLTINPLENQKANSVGKLISGVNSIITEIDSLKILEPMQVGMIYVAGENIFSGYLNHPSNPFEIINGIKYYKTGDLGYFDEDGYLFITGRLKRFIKIGGEMISLPFIEKVLLEKYGKEDIQTLAIEGSDKKQPALITLFTIEDLDMDEVNQYLIKSGVSPLAKIREITLLKEIPLLGSGKVDYKALKQQVEL